jgi:hypothetical protein
VAAATVKVPAAGIAALALVPEQVLAREAEHLPRFALGISV